MEVYAIPCEKTSIGHKLTIREQSKSRPLPKNSEEIKTEPDDQVESASMMTQWTHPSLQLHSVRHGYFDNTGYQTPVLKRSRSVYSIGDTPENMMRPKYERWPSETETTESALPSEVQSEITESVDDDDDSSKLKGVRYPGMGLFDSANELQKRKRNQRKDESVLRNMEQTSSGIEPTEFVWTEVGEFQRTRDIYASPSIEGSPVCLSTKPSPIPAYTQNLITGIFRSANWPIPLIIRNGGTVGLRQRHQPVGSVTHDLLPGFLTQRRLPRSTLRGVETQLLIRMIRTSLGHLAADTPLWTFTTFSTIYHSPALV